MPTEDIPNQNFESFALPETEKAKGEVKPGFKIPRKLKLALAIVASALAVLVILEIVFTQLKPTNPLELVTPTPTPTAVPPTEQIASPSAYATDSVILEIEVVLKELDKKIQETDLKQTSLQPPVLDLNINFEE